MGIDRYLRHIRLKNKIIGVTTLVIVMTTVVSSNFFYIRTKRLLFENLQKRGRTICENLTGSAKYGVLTEDVTVLTELAEGVIQQEDVVYVIIEDEHGKILAEKKETEIPGVNLLTQQALMAKAGGLDEIRDSAGNPLYNVYGPIITRKVTLAEMGGLVAEGESEETSGPQLRGAVMVGISLTNILNRLKSILQGIILLMLIIIGAGIVFSLGIVMLIMRPIMEMAQAAVRVASGDLTQTVRVEAKDEIGQFATQFNAMTKSLREREQQLEESYNELTEYKNRLEEKVEERTQELKEIQTELAQKEKLAAVGQLAAGVGHELRNPLAAIKNSVYYLKTKIGDRDPKVSKHVEIMDKEIGMANKIITDLLGFSRLSRVEVGAIDLNSVVEDTFVGLTVPETVKVRRELTPVLPPVKGDPDQLKQVFLNLAINAFQAMPSGGELKVATRRNVDSVEIEFTDNGEGIAPENLSRVFDPFFTTKSKGIGLGLAVSYGIIERHGGSINVQSTRGLGATFLVKLPVFSG